MRNRLRHYSISRNLTIGLFLAFGCVAGVTLYASLRFSSHQARVALQKKTDEYITSLADILAVPLWHFNEKVIEAIGQSYVQNDFIVAIRIESVVGDWDFRKDDPKSQTAFLRTGTICYQGETLGEVTIFPTTRYYAILNRRFFWSYTVTLVLMIVILSLVSGGLFRQLLQKPFMQFIDLVNAYVSGDQSAFSRHGTYIELEPLVAALKQMGDTISAQMRSLQRAEQKYRGIFDNTVAGIFQITPEGKFISANPALAGILGYDSPEELMKCIDDVQQQLYVDRRQGDEFIKLLEQEKHVEAFEVRLHRKDGSMMWGLLHARLVYDDRGNVQHYEGFLQDIAVRKQAEMEIQHLKEQLQAENIYLREEIKLEHNFDEIIGQSRMLKSLLSKVEQVAPTDTTVLISGETGTGKELIARALHHTGPRKDRPLVKVNCAALPAHLIESELFGHEKGAFTGATVRRIGRFEFAQEGTIFLDEIGELPLELQARLLRVIHEGEFQRVGSSRTLTCDVRVIAATNRNLKEEVRHRRFRQDLFYRLSVYPLAMPPLRDRAEDIPLLVQAFVQKFSKRLGKQIETIPQTAMNALQQYSWPGNVRELENVIERAVIISPDNTLRIELPQEQVLAADTGKTLQEVEREYILHVLQSRGWRVSGPKGAAVVLGLNEATLRSRMQKLAIYRPKAGKSPL